jgi:hypothetical protein
MVILFIDLGSCSAALAAALPLLTLLAPYLEA